MVRKKSNVFGMLLKIWHVPCFKKLILFIASLVPDKLYIQLIFKGKLGYNIRLDNPTTFNEKLNWCKLYNRNPQYTVMADKFAVKQVVKNKIGEEFVVKNLGVWNSFDDINFDSLPNSFVLKCTHDSSGAIICKDKATFDFMAARKKIKFVLSMNYFYACREWPYKDIPPRIIADEYLDDHSGKELHDYKFWCFHGVPTIMYITNKGEKVEENFYDMDFNPIDINHGFPRTLPEYTKPAEFELMKELAAKLSSGIPFVRVDFFDVDGKVYFGEYTFFDWAGLGKFKNYQQDVDLGKFIHIPEMSEK